MRDYFFCVFCASVLSSAVCVFLQGSPFEKTVKYVCSLMCIAVVILPVISLDESFDYTNEYSTFEKDDYSVIRAEAELSLKEHIQGLISQKFGINCNRVSIDLYSEEKTAVVESVTVYVSHQNTGEIKKYLEQELGGVIAVVNEG